MARDIKIQWYRANGQMSPKLIPMQIDDMSETEAAVYGGDEPYFRYHGFVNTLTYAFRYRDLLINPSDIDSITNQPTRYRVIAEPHVHTLSSYVRMALEKVVGT